MKISPYVSKNLSANSQWLKKHGIQAPPVPYERARRLKDKDDEEVSVFKLRTNPSDKDSQTYDLKVLTFKSGSVEEFLLWKKDLYKVLTGQNVQSATGKFAMTRRLLEGDALAAFNAEATTQSQETDANYTKCMHKLATYVFPKNALTIQRQWFHRYLHKPTEIKMREFVARINEINAYLDEYPPAFDKQQMITESEMKDLLEFAIPIIWRVKMAEHAFRPIDHDIVDIVEFCERIEFTEPIQKSTMNGDSDANPTLSQSHNGRNAKRGRNGRDNNGALTQAVSNNRTKKHKKAGKVVSYKDSDGSDGCRLHIWATDHTTAECRVIQKQVDNMRAQWDAQPHNANNNKRQKTNNKQPKQGGDLHVLVDTFNKAKARLEKEIKQRQMACGKRKQEAYLDIINTEEEKADEKDDWSFHSELEQLTLTDVSDEELEELVLSEIE